MLALLLVVGAGLAVGRARGGSLSTLATARLRGMPLAGAALALQIGARFVPSGSSIVAFALIVAGYGAMFVFAALNWRRAGMSLVALGALLNFVVILANRGMPVSFDAAARAGYSGAAGALVERGKHVLITGDVHLRFLSDVIPLPNVFRTVVSAGDLILWAGLILLVQHLMSGARGRHAALAPPAPERLTA